MSARFPDSATCAALCEGRHGDPFAHLGPHHGAVLALVPGARRLWLNTPEGSTEMTRHPDWPLFSGSHDGTPYRLGAEACDGPGWEMEDPYRFPPVLGEIDEYLIGAGDHRRLWQALGGHLIPHCGVYGAHFAVWAPAAARVSVVGDHNGWDGRLHPMRARGATGVWEIFLPGLTEGARYKYEILGPDGQRHLKADPLGFGAELRPDTASVLRFPGGASAPRPPAARPQDPMVIYEVHLGSWRRGEGNRYLSYCELADQLTDYALWMGFTHLELLPVTEHPFDGSWGYQPVGLYAPTSRHGTPQDFAALIDAAHRKGLGVILDWVPGHFPTDPHGLGRFDGTALYEHADPREGFHNDWNTLIYNYGRREVSNYLTANALFWLEEYRLDGLRVDAVASMLYRDYSRPEGGWVPNIHGGRENLEAIAFLQDVNRLAYGQDDRITTIAEESTSFPGVTRPVHEGGLGFGFKWNMGWMNDTLAYMREDFPHRPHHHDRLTFGLHYAYTENFILPISHDEVVHGKGSLLNKMPGHEGQKFAGLRAYYAFMWAHPGKKLLFMGQEFAQGREWNHDQSLDWHLEGDARHAGVQRLVRDLNGLLRASPALYRLDADPEGFRWIDASDSARSLLAFSRHGGAGEAAYVVACNFSPHEHRARLGFPAPGRWIEALNTDSAAYGGENRGNLGAVETEAEPWNGLPQSAEVVLPPLSVIFFRQA